MRIRNAVFQSEPVGSHLLGATFQSRRPSRRRKGSRLHASSLDQEEIVRRDSLPLTSVERTVADVIRTGMPEDQVYVVVRDALQRSMVSAWSTIKLSVSGGAPLSTIDMNRCPVCSESGTNTKSITDRDINSEETVKSMHLSERAGA